MRPKDERAGPSERYRPSNFQNAPVRLSLSPWPWLLCRIHYFFMLKWFLKPKMGVNWTPVDMSTDPLQESMSRPWHFRNVNRATLRIHVKALTWYQELCKVLDIWCVDMSTVEMSRRWHIKNFLLIKTSQRVQQEVFTSSVIQIHLQEPKQILRCINRCLLFMAFRIF